MTLMATVTISDINEIRALHRVLYKRKFLDPTIDEFFGSTYIANVQRQLLEALRERDGRSRWESWAKAADHTHALDRVAEAIANNREWWGDLGQTDREQFVLDCLAPLAPDAVLLASITATN